MHDEAHAAEDAGRHVGRERVGVTVVGAGRVALDPGRSDLEVLAKIRRIGGEQYLWEFARFTQRELEESKKPPPPTVSY